jgi:hypothetical protein
MRTLGKSLSIDRGKSKSSGEVHLFYICKFEGSYLEHKIAVHPEFSVVLFNRPREMPRHYPKSNHDQFVPHRRQFSSLIALSFYIRFELHFELVRGTLEKPCIKYK